jgi:Ni2+-binding GTPase involved in maturation of urease and hydrogenase
LKGIQVHKPIASLFYDRIAEAVATKDKAASVLLCRRTLESIFKELTEGSKRSFDGLYARIQYVINETQVSKELVGQIHRLRIYCNKVVHDEKPATDDEVLVCVKTLCLIVKYFFNAPVPTELEESYAKSEIKEFEKPAFIKAENIEECRLLILNVMQIQETDSGGRYFTVQAKSEDENIGEDEFELQLWDSATSKLTNLQPLLKPYQTLMVYDFKKTPRRENHYSTDVTTQVVLEPDILLDISEIAECFSGRTCQPLQFLLKKLLPQDYNSAAFQGNMVNALLDAALLNPDLRAKQAGLKEIFREAVSEQAFQAAVYGRETLVKIFDEIKERHWPNLIDVANNNQNKKLHIEPTFFSSKYGIQGRLDVLAEDEDNSLKKDIFELKSGNAPNHGTWVNNQMQVVGYNMLLRSTYGKDRRGTSAIIYSRVPNDYERNVVYDTASASKLLEVRNTALSWLLEIADNNYSVLDSVTPELGEGQPQFLADTYSRFHNEYQQAMPIAKEYYQAFLSFTVREWLNAKIGMYGSSGRDDRSEGFSALWLSTEAQKEGNFSIITGLRCTAVNVRTGILNFHRNLQSQQHNFRRGDTVLVYPRSKTGELKPLQQQILKGRLDEISLDGVSVSLNNRQMSKEYFQRDNEDWVLEHDIYESNYWTITRSLFNVLSKNNFDKLSLLLGKTPPAEQDNNEISFPGLNPNQATIINKSINARDYFLIQGPPGTGKTSVILPHMVKALLEHQNGSVVIVAFTNRAVDEISMKLESAKIPFFQMGSRGSEAEKQLRQHCLDGSIQKARELITSQRVFLSTVATLSSRLDVLHALKNDLTTLIIDEASQLTEPQLVGLVMRFPKFVLIGDQNQLPPVVAQDEKFYNQTSNLLKENGIQDLSMALFERLMAVSKNHRWNHAYDMLTTHYRMHQQIADVINPWYAGKLLPGREEQKHNFALQKVRKSSPWSDALASGRLVFIPSPTEKTNKFHETEAIRIVELLKCIRSAKGDDFVPDETVGVVTPWRTQIANIRNKLNKHEDLIKVNIETVERFQGSENDIILVSLAVYHPGQLSMLRSPGVFTHGDNRIELDKKLLVTISRAKSQIILLGDEKVIRLNKHYSSLIDQMHKYDMPITVMA